MSPAKAKTGERLPYLLGKLKAPRVLERLEQTAALAREQSWPYERFLESLLEAEVFARDASGARNRIRYAGFPALKSLEDFDWAAQPSAERPLVLHLAQLAWIEECANVCFLGPPGPPSHCPPCGRHGANSPASGSETWIRKPLRCPLVISTARSSPRWTLCKTVWRATPSRFAASSSGT
jgi:IstB-like ATP binding protein